MKRKILLPNNALGVIIMLAMIILSSAAVFAAAFWVLSLVAPWWVALPCSALAAMIGFLKTVKFKNQP